MLFLPETNRACNSKRVSQGTMCAHERTCKISGTTHSVKMRLIESTMKRETSSFRSLNMSNCSRRNGTGKKKKLYVNGVKA